MAVIEKSIKLEQKNTPYTLKISARARRMRLAVYCDGTVVMMVPQHADVRAAERFITSKSQWIIEKLKHFKKFSGTVLIRGGKREFAARKTEALALAEARTAHFNVIYRFHFNSITIKNQKTRWGSCSLRGNLNFNYKIAQLPPHLADYIIVHELCHLGQFNHSKKFWDLVAKTLPEHRDLRRELKEYRF